MEMPFLVMPPKFLHQGPGQEGDVAIVGEIFPGVPANYGLANTYVGQHVRFSKMLYVLSLSTSTAVKIFSFSLLKSQAFVKLS